VRAALERDVVKLADGDSTMKVVAFITNYAAVDRIIDHLKLTFMAAEASPSHVFEQVALAAAEGGGEYE
jgi:hypothetical protein